MATSQQIIYPTIMRYQELLQHPHLYLLDNELQQGKLKINNLGLPTVASGGFAAVFRVKSKKNVYALRCFFKYSDTLEQRTKEVSNTLRNLQNNPYTVDFEYQANGISSLPNQSGNIFPIVKMEWVDGLTLREFLARNYKDAKKMKNLHQSFCDLENYLVSHNIAHCDISLANVMVKDKDGKQIVLIDYDGMFVPSLQKLNTADSKGDDSFQHPKRTGKEWNSKLDYFSFQMLNLSLFAVQKYPDLFKNDDKAIIFEPKDYNEPQNSAVFKKLLTDAETKKLAEDFFNICQLSNIENIPRVDWSLGGSIMPRQRGNITAGIKTAGIKNPINKNILKILLGEKEKEESNTANSNNSNDDTDDTDKTNTKIPSNIGMLNAWINNNPGIKKKDFNSNTTYTSTTRNTTNQKKKLTTKMIPVLFSLIFFTAAAWLFWDNWSEEQKNAMNSNAINIERNISELITQLTKEDFQIYLDYKQRIDNLKTEIEDIKKDLPNIKILFPSRNKEWQAKLLKIENDITDIKDKSQNDITIKKQVALAKAEATRKAEEAAKNKATEQEEIHRAELERYEKQLEYSQKTAQELNTKIAGLKDENKKLKSSISSKNTLTPEELYIDKLFKSSKPQLNLNANLREDPRLGSKRIGMMDASRTHKITFLTPKLAQKDETNGGLWLYINYYGYFCDDNSIKRILNEQGTYNYECRNWEQTTKIGYVSLRTSAHSSGKILRY